MRTVTGWLVLGATQMAMVLLLGAVLPGFRFVGIVAMILTFLFFAVFNPLAYWVFVSVGARLHPYLFPAFSLGATGLIVISANWIVPGLIVQLWSGVSAVLALTAANTVVGSLLMTADYQVAIYDCFLMPRVFRSRARARDLTVPGVLFLEIDGLSESVLRHALDRGFMPTLKRWLESESHKLIGWECDLSSQTSASQAGILLGHNTDIPAFRWYDKSRGTVVVSNRPGAAADIERRLSDGQGLLSHHGSSVANMFSGDAPENILTFSTVTDRKRTQSPAYFAYLFNPYTLVRLATLLVVDIFKEVGYASWQRLRDQRPRVFRGGVYPLLRAVTTSTLREVTMYSLIGEMMRGVRVVYTTFVGYDEVAHHSGIERRDAMGVLKGLDRQFKRLERAARFAPRRYQLVVLSDHGQSKGATFKQRFGESFRDFIVRCVSTRTSVSDMAYPSEAWANVNVALTDVTLNDTRTARALRRVTRSRTVGGQVMLGPERHEQEQNLAACDTLLPEVVVLASGNLGLIYFTSCGGRLTYEQISGTFPRLIPDLLRHPGIGFLLVHSVRHGALAMGARGIHYLDERRVEGEDPLASFGANAPAHLRRFDRFSNVADITVNSAYDAKTGEVIAFEEKLGCHGGLGGYQSQPFILFPSVFDAPQEPIVGAAQVHHVLCKWLEDVDRLWENGAAA